MAQRQTNILDMFRNKVTKPKEPELCEPMVLQKELAQEVQEVEQLQQEENAEFSDVPDTRGCGTNPCISAATQVAQANSTLTVDTNLLNANRRKFSHYSKVRSSCFKFSDILIG